MTEDKDDGDFPQFFDASEGPYMRPTDPPDWFTDADAQILFVLLSGLVLSPSIIAENTQVTRQTVSRRLDTLQAAGYVEKVGRGKYKATPDGLFELTGDPSVFPNYEE